MKQVYFELVFLDNFLLDFILLFFSFRLSEKRVNFKCLFIGAAIGGLYGALSVALPILNTFIAKLFASALLCMPGGLRPFRLYLRRILFFYSISFLFGGILFAFLCTQTGYLVGSVQFPLLRFILIGLCILCLFIEFWLRQNYPRVNLVYTLSFQLYEHQFCFRAFVDTGNQLRDMGGNGVIIAKRNQIEEQLSIKELEMLYTPLKAPVPVRTFSCNTAIGTASLFAFAPQKIILSDNRRSYSLKAYIALCDFPLPSHCDALLPQNLRLHPTHFNLPPTV